VVAAVAVVEEEETRFFEVRLLLLCVLSPACILRLVAHFETTPQQ
jgi:hypothetical protein